MRFSGRRLGNWAVVALMTLFFGGILAFGVFKEQLGEVLFNATLV